LLCFTTRYVPAVVPTWASAVATFMVYVFNNSSVGSVVGVTVTLVPACTFVLVSIANVDKSIGLPPLCKDKIFVDSSYEICWLSVSITDKSTSLPLIILNFFEVESKVKV